MPNWTFNEIECNNADVIRSIVNDDGDVDFNKIVPMSDELNIEVVSVTDDAIIYYVSNRLSISENECKDIVSEYSITLSNQYRRIKENMENGYKDYNDTELYNLGERYVSNFKKYGHMNWYHWRWANWGVKWNASNSCVSDDFTACDFDTAWNLPFAIFEKICEMFPNEEINFTGRYEEGYRYSGFNDNGHFVYELD